MAPYGRDAGMTESQAERLAGTVADALGGPVQVEREGRYFVLVVESASGRFTLRDETDWAWLQQRL